MKSIQMKKRNEKRNTKKKVTETGQTVNNMMEETHKIKECRGREKESKNEKTKKTKGSKKIQKVI